MKVGQEPASVEIDRQHVEIVSVCDRLTFLSKEEDQVGEIAAIRMRLAILLQANVVLEEREIFGPLRSLEKADRPRLFETIELQAAELRRRYSEHVRKWNVAAIQHTPTEYADAALQLIRDVRGRVRTEA